ncbi:hypothetical protein GN956_G5838 [Arapaima gigas]
MGPAAAWAPRDSHGRLSHALPVGVGQERAGDVGAVNPVGFHTVCTLNQDELEHVWAPRDTDKCSCQKEIGWPKMRQVWILQGYVDS